MNTSKAVQNSPKTEISNVHSLPERLTTSSLELEDNSQNIEETIDTRQRLLRTDGYNDEINSNIVKNIKASLFAEADKLALKHGLTCARLVDDFDDQSAEFNLVFSVIDMMGFDVYTRNFITNADKVGLHAKYLGKRFFVRDVEYMITGLDTRDSNKPLVRLKSPDGVILSTVGCIKKRLLNK